MYFIKNKKYKYAAKLRALGTQHTLGWQAQPCAQGSGPPPLSCHVQEWLSLLKSISLHNKRTTKNVNGFHAF